MTLEEATLSVWRQALEENLNLVEVGGARVPVRRTSRHRLRQVDFQFEGQSIRGLEQNPATKSRWAEMARRGQKVMQFLSGGKYFANVADGKVTLYGKSAATEGSPAPQTSSRAKSGG